MPDIFLSYRRADSAGHAGRLYDRLKSRFPDAHIFMDVDSIAPGVDFVERIEEALASCHVAVVVIGDEWLDAKGPDGRRRIDDPDDFVRLEIAAALGRGVTVVPVLVKGARMPNAADLPEDIRPLARQNAIELSEDRWHYDAGRLIQAISQIAAEAEKTPDPRRRLPTAPPSREPPADAGGSPLEDGAQVREERKVVTVLVADLDFTSRSERMDVEDARDLATPFHRRLHAQIERFGGTADKLIGDAVIGVFGAPTAHEDDPERAVRAALAIRDAVADANREQPDLGVHVAVGVNSGEAFVVIGEAGRQHERALGDVANASARLQAAAGDDAILVGEPTYRATRSAIEYRPAAPVRVKGKTEPLPAWEAVAARSRGGADADQEPRALLVGRERELELLVEAFERSRREQACQLVTLLGVPGIGKSRLVWELRRQLAAADLSVRWRQGRSLPYGDGVTFWALGEIVKAHAGVLDDDTADVAGDKLRAAVAALVPDPAEREWMERHLGSLLGLAVESEGGDQRSAFAAWRRFLEALADDGPLVVVFEDLHWADDALLDFVDYLAEWAATVPLLLLATARPELLERRRSWGGGKPNATTIALSPLSAEDTARLLAALLERTVLPADVQATLLARSEGNPLYAEEYIRMLSDRGFLRREGGSVRLERTDELPLPESVGRVIAARLDALSGEEKRLLQAAAVLGKVFWLGGASAIGGVAPWEAEERSHLLERKEFVRRERRSSISGDMEYAFGHALVRDVAYGQITRSERAEKHRRAGDWIASFARDREDRAEMLVHHYVSALRLIAAAGGDTTDLAEPARRSLREAGENAAAMNAPAAAARFFADALELWPPEDPDRATLLLAHGRAIFHSESRGEEVLLEARDALLAAGERAAAAEAEAMVAILTWRRGDTARAVEHDARALELVAWEPPSRAKAYVLARAAGARIASGESEAGIPLAREAARIASELGLDELEGQALAYLGRLTQLAGDESGIADLERGIAIQERTRAPELPLMYLHHADFLGSFGDLARMFDLHSAARAAAEQIGDRGLLRWLAAEHVSECFWRGDWDEAVASATRLIAESQGGERHYLEGALHVQRGRIRLARGDVAGAASDVEHALAFDREAQDPQVFAPSLAFEALVLRLTGRPEDATRAEHELLATWGESSGILATLQYVGSDLAHLLLVSTQRAALLAAAERVPMRSRWLDALRAVTSGDFTGAADTYEQIGSAPDEAWARLRAAEAALSATGTPADDELARATSFYERVGANAALQDARRARASA